MKIETLLGLGLLGVGGYLFYQWYQTQQTLGSMPPRVANALASPSAARQVAFGSWLQ